MQLRVWEKNWLWNIATRRLAALERPRAKACRSSRAAVLAYELLIDRPSSIKNLNGRRIYMKTFSSVVVTLIGLVLLTVPSWAGPGSDGDGGPAPWCAPGTQCCGSLKNPKTSNVPCCYACVRTARTFGDINAPLTRVEYDWLVIAPVSSATKGHNLDRLANEDQQTQQATRMR